jgi:hypothetical protein
VNNMKENPAEVFTAAGDIAYADAANSCVRLAKGAAYTTLRMNAGATAPQWASIETNSTSVTDTTNRDMNGNGAWNDIPGYTVNLVTTFSSSVLAIAVIECINEADYGGQTRLLIDGTATHTQAETAFTAAIPQIRTLVGRKASVPAGTVTVHLEHNGAAGHDMDYNRLDMIVIARGL